MGRLEEYKELQSSIKWMIFDIVYDAQDVSLKAADVFILLNAIGAEFVVPFCQWYTRSRNFRLKRKVFSFRLSVSAAEIKG